MDNTIYHPVEVQIDPRLPTPGIRDVAEVFGTSARHMDQAHGVKTVSGQPGVYRVGVTGAGAQQIRQGHASGDARISPDFYVR